MLKDKEQIRYFRNRKFMAFKDVPQAVRDYPNFDETFTLDEDVEANLATQTETTTEKASRPCLFCSEEGIRPRYVNMKTVYLCQEHYINTNLGKIVAHMRSA
jgi:hypothetical protein